MQETLIPTVRFDLTVPKYKQVYVLHSQTFTATVQPVTPIVFHFVSFPRSKYVFYAAFGG